MTNITRREVLRWGATSLLTPTALSGLLHAAEPAAVAPVKKDPYADAIRVKGEPALPTTGSFTIAVLPDTQNYSEKYPETYLAQTAWVAENCQRRNIAAVLHLGDIVQNTTPGEWELAQRAMNRFDGVVPYFMTVGNHDCGTRGNCESRDSLYSQYFPVEKFSKTSNFGGVYDREPQRMENSFHTFKAGNRDFLVLTLEFGPRSDVLRWANEVVAKYPKHTAMLITHAHTYHDDTRYDWKTFGPRQSSSPHRYGIATKAGGEVNDGEDVWSKLLSKHENFSLVMGGHVGGDGLGRLASQTAGGRDVHQLLVNFQSRPNGGDGWLRLLEFKADGTTVDAIDYSPLLGERNESAQNRFSMKFSPPA